MYKFHENSKTYAHALVYNQKGGQNVLIMIQIDADPRHIRISFICCIQTDKNRQS